MKFGKIENMIMKLRHARLKTKSHAALTWLIATDPGPDDQVGQ